MILPGRASQVAASSQRLQELGKNYQPKTPYPQTPLANRLKLAAQLIDAGLGARIFYVSIDGFDTHANQLATHANLLAQVSGAMTAFYKDLAARGHKVQVTGPWSNGKVMAVRLDTKNGVMHGAVSPRTQIGYVMGD